ncbi:hypothetical protein [Novosphingobium soli]|uniref:Uncharacterized protein n=1 Tax=Novosphingobium soli TaxID=574956 RepID=A0ABV6CV04_9SPHN
MPQDDTGAPHRGGRAHAAALMARYPHLTDTELDSLTHWFRREASALDVGLLASDPAVAAQYRAYSKAHRDRLTARDLLLGALLLALAAAAIALLAAAVP